MTNYEKIKQMMVEELAKFMLECNSSFQPCEICSKDICINCGSDKCEKQVIKYLESEAKL